jgi:hypothetical protein
MDSGACSPQSVSSLCDTPPCSPSSASVEGLALPPPRLRTLPPTRSLPRPKPRYPQSSTSPSVNSFCSASSFTSATPPNSFTLDRPDAWLGLSYGPVSLGAKPRKRMGTREPAPQQYVRKHHRTQSELADYCSVSGRGGSSITWSSRETVLNSHDPPSRNSRGDIRCLENWSRISGTNLGACRGNKTAGGERVAAVRHGQQEDDDGCFSKENDEFGPDKDDWMIPRATGESQSMILPSLRRKRLCNAPIRPSPRKDSQPLSKRVSLHGLVTGGQSGHCKYPGRPPLSSRLIPTWTSGRQHVLSSASTAAPSKNLMNVFSKKGP